MCGVCVFIKHTKLLWLNSACSYQRMSSEGMEKRVRRKKGRGVCLIEELPSSIVVEILSRLPICSLLRCKCVCKTWRDIVSDPFFARTHLATACVSAATRSRTNVMAVLHGRDNVELFELEPTHHDYTRCPPIKSMRFKTKLRLPGEQPSDLSLVGCCNGLLCLHQRPCHGRPSRVYVCNPLLGEYVPLPPPNPNPNCKPSEFYMFGFSSVTGRYKILRFLDTLPRWYPITTNTNIKVDVFTLGSDDAWRNLGNAPCPPFRFRSYNLEWMTSSSFPTLNGGHDWDWHSSSVTLNGSVHWLSNRSSHLITRFDIDTEQFHPFPHPPQMELHPRLQPQTLRLKVLQNCLCLLSDRIKFPLTIWCMKEYGVAESWIRLCTLEKTSFPASLPSVIPKCELLPFSVWKDGELLISASFMSNRLISCDFNQTRVSILKVYGMKLGIVIPVDFVPSLLSLKDIAIPDSVKIVGVHNYT